MKYWRNELGDFEDHKVVQFARLLLKSINENKIKGVASNDIILLNHILKNKVKEYDIVKLLDKLVIRNKDVIKKYGIKYKSLSEFDDETTSTKKVYTSIDIMILGNELNILEIRLPFLPKNKFDPLIKFFKEEIGLQFEYRQNTDPVWFTIIRDESIFPDLFNNEIIKEVGYNIDKKRVVDSIKLLRENIKKQKELFKLSATANLGDTEEFQGIFEKLYPFQKVALEYSKHKNSILIADEMGLGKSLQALSIIEYKDAYPALIVVPANLKSNWIKEIDKWMNHRTAHAVNSNVIPPSDIIIVSYNKIPELASRLNLRKFKAIVCDESHYLKNPKSQRTSSVLKYFKNVPLKTMTTGTPILNRTIELVPQLKFLGVLDTHFGGKRKFINRYAPPLSNGWGVTYGNANTEELQVELRKSCMLRRLKRDVISELPEKSRQIVTLPLSDYRAYHKVEIDSINWFEQKLKDQNLSKTEINKKVQDKLQSRSMFAEKMVKVEYLRQAAVTYKMDAVYDWIDNVLDQTNKFIIFGYHRDIVEKLYERYKSNAVMLYGGMSNQTQKIVDKFVNDDNIKLFIGSVQASGVGIDGLQAVCDKAAFVEMPWTPGLLMQAEDRIHRIGQTGSVNIYYLIGENSIEEYVYSVLVEKEDVFEKATNINQLFNWIKKKQK